MYNSSLIICNLSYTERMQVKVPRIIVWCHQTDLYHNLDWRGMNGKNTTLYIFYGKNRTQRNVGDSARLFCRKPRRHAPEQSHRCGGWSYEAGGGRYAHENFRRMKRSLRDPSDPTPRAVRRVWSCWLGRRFHGAALKHAPWKKIRSRD